jgi:hypothetical protein
LVNDPIPAGEEPIFLNSVLSKKLKEHQRDGIRFLWWVCLL